MENHKQLFSGRDAGTRFRREHCYHRYFESEVEKHPDAVAVVTENEQVTYRVLNRRANFLAHKLIHMGVGPDVPVGVYLERSIELVAAVMAIAKAGGAIVPLDPEYPGSYLNSILQETALHIIVTRVSNPSEFSRRDLEYVYMDRCVDSGTDWAFQNPSVSMSPDNLCGMFFTSGSTGLPKGVMITYRSSLSRFDLIKGLGLLGCRVRHLVQDPVSVGPLIGNIFYALATGGKLVLAKSGGERDGDYLLEVLNNHHVNTINSSPTLLQHLFRNEDSFRESELQYILTSGENIPASLQKRIQTMSDIVLFKFYGLTEAATVTYCKYQQDQDTSTVGCPAYSRVYVIDDQMKRVSEGVVGDIYVSGVGLARGYLNKPALTATSFIANRFDTNGGRLFRTGDRGRWHGDGALELVGRSDEQIKVRGVRVEVGEVESVLAQYPDVESAAVVADKTKTTSAQLVAYVVTEAASRIESDTLRQYLVDRLPGYMVPVLFIFLEKMPVLANGKIDRYRLPDQNSRTLSASERTIRVPETPEEHAVRLIWSEVLGVTQIAVDNNFFSLGGSSLDLTRVVSRIRETLGISLPLGKVFRSPTLQNMARIVSVELAQLSDREICALLGQEHRKNADHNG